jgi:hypothetical protein
VAEPSTNNFKENADSTHTTHAPRAGEISATMITENILLKDTQRKKIRKTVYAATLVSIVSLTPYYSVFAVDKSQQAQYHRDTLPLKLKS